MKPQTRFTEKGFSLLEVLIVVAIAMVLLGMAIIGIQSSLGSYKADAAANVVSSQLRMARQAAIAKRRWVNVWFDTTIGPPDNAPHINYQVFAQPGDPPQPVVSLPLPQGSQFYVFPNLPDTPMGFGNVSAVYIGGISDGPPTMGFSTTGAFVSNHDTFGAINGTAFVGTPGQLSTARAVTILGATGRVRTYYWSGKATGWRE
jgi:prepilin-type N-terminal cleavage/methylation domain-containing protein